MQKNKICNFILFIFLTLLFSCVTWAAKLTLGTIEPGEYHMAAINNHTPSLYKNVNEYQKSFQKVELEIGGTGQFKDLPKLGLKNPYTGTIQLGDTGQKFGVIVDIIGEEKRLYIDTDGNGSFADEHWVPLLNEWLEWLDGQNYMIVAPEPITLMVGYKSRPGNKYPVEISISGALIEPGVIPKTKPYLLVEVRTWFLAKVNEDGSDKLMAVVDYNNNGRFNDPEDRLLIDYNDDGLFTLDEALIRKKGLNLKSGRQKLKVDWDVYPDSLRIGGLGQ